MLLPSEERNQAKLMSTVTATAERVLTFCDRNAVACQKSAEYWAIFAKKAEFGARMLIDVANERGRQGGPPQQTASTRETLPARPILPAPASTTRDSILPGTPVPQVKVRTEVIGKPGKSAAAADGIDTLLRQDDWAGRSRT